MSLELEEALRRAAAGPVPTLDLDRVLTQGRGRRRVMQLAAVTGAGALLLVLSLAVVSVRPTVAPIVGSEDATPAVSEGVVAVETAVGYAAARLAVLPARVPVGHVPVTVVVNDGAVPLLATPRCSVDRREAGTWTDLGQRRLGTPFEIAPGEPGPWRSCLAGTSVSQLPVGRYRIRWELSVAGLGLEEPRITLGAEFEVVDGDQTERLHALPTSARPTAWQGVVPDELADAMELSAAEEVFLLPVSAIDRMVPVAVREGRPPLVGALSCDGLTALELPDGWAGLCLERTVDGRSLAGRRFPYGTTSLGEGVPPPACRFSWEDGWVPSSWHGCVYPDPDRHLHKKHKEWR